MTWAALPCLPDHGALTETLETLSQNKPFLKLFLSGITDTVTQKLLTQIPKRGDIHSQPAPGSISKATGKKHKKGQIQYLLNLKAQVSIPPDAALESNV